MKILDRYILIKFLSTFVFIIGLLIGITVVIDLSEKIDNLIEHKVGFWVTASEYYIYFIPYITALLGPFFVLVSVIFFTSQLAERSEIIAILNSGTSFYRLLIPYGIGAVILAIVLGVSNHYLVPFSNKKRIEFERKYISRGVSDLRFSFHRMIGPGTFLYVENYKPSESAGFRFSLERFNNKKLQSKLKAERIEWLPQEKKWRLHDVFLRKMINESEIHTEAATADSAFNFTPDDFTFTESVKEVMSTPELDQFISVLNRSGQSDSVYYQIERHRRSASAFSVLIMTLIGLSVASRKVRGGLGWHLVLGIGLSALYEIIMKFSTTFSANAGLPPFMGVWIPNFIYLLMAVGLLVRAPK